MAARVVVLASGSGTVLQALLDAASSGDLSAAIVAVGTDVEDAPALGRATASGIATFVCRPTDHFDRAAWNTALLQALDSWQPDLIVTAGFMRILGPTIIDAFPGRIINTHPALLPAFPGAHPVRDALAHGVKVTGCTVHVVDHGMDTGPILAQRAVDILEGEDEAALHERIKAVERELLVSTVAQLTSDRRDR